jgi:hypothetical protein
MGNSDQAGSMEPAAMTGDGERFTACGRPSLVQSRWRERKTSLKPA